MIVTTANDVTGHTITIGNHNAYYCRSIIQYPDHHAIFIDKRVPNNLC